MGKIVDRNELADIRQKYNVVVSTNGCYDLIHIGHLRFLQSCKKLGDCLVVGVNSDQSVKQLKGPDRPLVPENDRAEIIAGMACVDYVHIFDELTPDEWLKIVKPNIHCKGADYNIEEIAERQVVEECGGRVQLIKLVPGVSTTRLIGKISSRHGVINLRALADVVTIDDNHTWGREHRLINNDLYCAKFLEYMNNQHSGSDHYHKNKTETFKVLEGRVMIEREYRTGDEIIIPPTYRHKVKSITEHAVILEASTHHEDSDTYRVKSNRKTPHVIT